MLGVITRLTLQRTTHTKIKCACRIHLVISQVMLCWWCSVLVCLLCVNEIYAAEFNLEATKSRVCSIGNFSLDVAQSFSKSKCASELEPFLSAWNPKLHQIFTKKSTSKDIGKIDLNSGGNCLYHSFAIWMMLKKLKENNEIDSYVESGVWKGRTAQMVRNLMGPDFPIVLVDTFLHKNEDAWIPEGKIHDFRGKNFQDFAKIDFSKIGIDPARSIVLFDDHMDQLRRLQEAKASGFQHVMFDDNFIPGSGDIYSLKNVCDNTRKFRRYITTGAGADSKRKNRRCDMFHKTCLPLTASMIKENYKTLMEIVDVYYEFPPLGPISKPYHQFNLKSSESKAPHKENMEVWTRRVRSYIKPSIFTGEEFLSWGFDSKLQQTMDEYLNFVYVHLK